MARVYVPGVFDVFHIGHLNYIQAAAEQGDYLIVGVQDDRSVRKLKGTKLVNLLPERIAIIEALRCVDEVISYIDVSQGKLLKGLNIDVFVCSEDYAITDEYPEQKETLQFCEQNNIKVVRLERTVAVSSTAVRSQLRDFWSSRAAKSDDLPAGVTVLGSFSGDQAKVEEESETEAGLVLIGTTDSERKSLLDLGCGDGRLLMHLAPHFATARGVDYSSELIELAKQKTSEYSNVSFEASDATTYQDEKNYDVLLLSGLIPCLDDLQMETMTATLENLAHPATQLFVRASIAVKERLDVVNQYATELNAIYTAYYRTPEEIIEMYSRYGWELLENQRLYQHREETAVDWFVFARKK